MQVQPAMPIMLDVLSGLAPNIALSLPHDKVMPPRPDVSENAEMEAALHDLAAALQPFDIALKFSKDDETGAIVVQFINQQSGETLQQIPSAARLHVAATLSKLQGRIVNHRA